MARKGQFKKGGGRVGARRASRSRRRSTAMTHAPRRRSVARAHHKGRRRRHHSGGGMKLTHLAIASAGLAFMTSAKSPVKALTDFADKIPGTKTFGAPAMIGVACLAVDRFVKPNKWLKLLGTAGIVLAAVKVGSEGTDFKFVGDEGAGDVGDYDLADEDVGDDVGDDDLGDDD